MPISPHAIFTEWVITVSADMVTIYRVENTDKIGPYQACLDPHQAILLQAMLTHHESDRATHPGPYRDGCGYIKENQRCAFESVEHLRDWFRGYGKILSQSQFRVNLYRVPRSEVKFGRHQCLIPAPIGKPSYSYDPQTVIA
jgi:hypothetical protein